MGYRGKLAQQERARELRASGMTLLEIATRLGVAKSSVSVWVRDVPFIPSSRRTGPRRRPHPFHDAKLAQIAQCDAEGLERIGTLSADAFLAAGVALYAGEGSKTDGSVKFANTDPAMIRFFCSWLRQCFDIEEHRMRGRVYLHEGLDIERTERYWSQVSGMPRAQFQAPYRAVADASIRTTKHEHGCFYVIYCSAVTHRGIMGLVRALLSSPAIPG